MGFDMKEWIKKRKHEREVRYNNTQIRYSEREWFCQQTFDYLKDNRIHGDYYEFGCHKGLTFSMALREADRKNIDWMQFYAFDSFEGLPEPTGIDIFPIWKKGALYTSEERFLNKVKKPGFFTDKIHTIKGFYQYSLTSDLQRQLLEKSKISLAYIDCDLYESTKDVLKFIDPLLQKGSVLYFDDYYLFAGDPERGEQRAFSEFQKKTKHRFNPHLSVGWFGRSFIIY